MEGDGVSRRKAGLSNLSVKPPGGCQECVGVVTRTESRAMQRNKKTKVLYRYRSTGDPLPEYPYRRYSFEEFITMGWNDLSFRVNLTSIWFSATYRAHGLVNLLAEHNLKTWEQADDFLHSKEVQRIRGRKQ